MRKIALVTAAALMASAGTYALAQGAGPGAGPAPGRQEARGLSQDDYNRLVDSRIAAIKAGLRLSPDQEKLWQPVEDAVRANAADRFTRFQERDTSGQGRQDLDLMQRLEARSTMMTANAQRMSTLVTALRPLWNTFSEDQKRIAPRLLREAMAGGGMMDRGERGGRRGRDGEHGRMGGMMEHGGMGPGGMMGSGGQGQGGMSPGGMMGRGGPQGQPPRQP